MDLLLNEAFEFHGPVGGAIATMEIIAATAVEGATQALGAGLVQTGHIDLQAFPQCLTST